MIELFPIPSVGPGRLAIALRPRGGDWLPDEVQSLAGRGWTVLVSALEDPEQREFELERAPEVCAKLGIEYFRLPIPDRGLPGLREAEAAARTLCDRVAAGGSVAVHCRQGIGRSSLICAATLVTAGIAPDEAWSMIEQARGRSVPDTIEQRAWLATFSPSRAS